jgi:hypothetical protein
MIRKMLDISTEHLPDRFWDPVGSDEEWGNVPLFFDTPNGRMVWVPDSPDDPGNAGEGEEAVPDEIMALWRYARERGCDWIMLDLDADVEPGLPVWDEA